MKKWANYLISKVRYDSENLISTVIRHQDTDLGITYGESVDRSTIVSDIKNGLSYMTIYNGKNSWKKGHKIQTFSIRGTLYLRIDGNKVKLDYLGDLPELLLVKSDSILELIPESPIQPEIKPSPTSKGSLPKESADELPQELELVPEIEPEKIVRSKLSTIQLAQLDDLQRQIDALQNILSNSFSFKFESTEKMIPKQFSKIIKSKNQLENVEFEYNLIQTLQKQNKKLDDIEKKLHDLGKIK